MITSLDQARARYDLITVTHVLEFIEDPRERVATLRELGKRLKRTSHLLVSLRGWSDVLSAKKPTRRGDGIVTGLGTWTRGYTVAEARELIDAAGLVIAGAPHGPKSQAPEQVRFVCKAKQ